LSSTTPSDVLRVYSQALRVAAPREWETFVECFDAYATDVTVAVTNAEQHEILVAQGKAKAFLHLLALFRTCHVQPQPKSP
jgi:hypothetical protein